MDWKWGGESINLGVTTDSILTWDDRLKVDSYKFVAKKVTK